jgi:hypothetical protein
MKRFSEYVSEEDDSKTIHLVPHEDGVTWKGKTDRDSHKAYGVLGARRPAMRSVDGKKKEDMMRYHSSIAKDSGFNVKFHDA